MKVINHNDLQLNLKKCLDSFVDDVEELIVIRKNQKDVVIISLEDYNSLKETIFLLSGKNRKILLKSIEVAKAG